MPISLHLVGVDMETNGKKCLQFSILFSVYIYCLMLFVVDNLHYFQTNCSVHEIDTRYKNNLHTPSFRLAAVQRATAYSAIKIFNKLPPRTAFPKLISSGDHFYQSECSTDYPTLVPFESKLFEILNYSV
jgi:hypothetical protein